MVLTLKHFLILPIDGLETHGVHAAYRAWELDDGGSSVAMGLLYFILSIKLILQSLSPYLSQLFFFHILKQLLLDLALRRRRFQIQLSPRLIPIPHDLMRDLDRHLVLQHVRRVLLLHAPDHRSLLATLKEVPLRINHHLIIIHLKLLLNLQFLIAILLIIIVLTAPYPVVFILSLLLCIIELHFV